MENDIRCSYKPWGDYETLVSRRADTTQIVSNYSFAYNSNQHLINRSNTSSFFSDTFDFSYSYGPGGRIDQILQEQRYPGSRTQYLARFFYNSAGLIDSLWNQSVFGTTRDGSRFILSHSATGLLTGYRVDYFSDTSAPGQVIEDLTGLTAPFGWRTITAYDQVTEGVRTFDYRSVTWLSGSGRRQYDSIGLAPIQITGSQIGLRASNLTLAQVGGNLVPWQAEVEERTPQGVVVERKYTRYYLSGNVNPIQSDISQNLFDAYGNLVERITEYRISNTWDRYTYSRFYTEAKQCKPRVLRAEPNPARDWLCVSGSRPGTAYTLVDAHGRVHQSGFLDARSMLSVVGMPAGLYMLQTEGAMIRILVD